MQGTNWVKTKDDLPNEEEAVFVTTYGRTVQYITYELIHCVNLNELRWFPYRNSDHDSVALEDFDHWMYVKDLPLPMPEGE